MSSEGAGNMRTDDERIDLYLSGGGYRAALGALGVLFFLLEDGRWSAVTRIVSVSGGSIVNAHLATTRPGPDALGAELRRMFDRLTSRRSLWLGFGIIGTGLVAAVALATLTRRTSSWLESILVFIVAAGVTVPLSVRLWLHLQFKETTGTARLGDLMSTGWRKEHVFVASDLSGHGSFFFVANCIQPQLCSTRLGFFDGRDMSLLKALRASTALPPLLPAVLVPLVTEPPRRSSAVGTDREWLSSPRPDAPGSVVLVDGGLTGNLGIQLDSELAPDNITLLDIIGSRTLAGTRADGPPMPYHCRHRMIAWICRECSLQRIVVDVSGRAPRNARLLSLLLNLPVFGPLIHAIRSLQIGYESSLADDQYLAGQVLVGMVRSERIYNTLAIEGSPLNDSSSAPARMMAAGMFLGRRDNLSEPAYRPRLGVTPLLEACIAACNEAAKVRTGLWGVKRSRAARVVASGYLNAFVSIRGREDYATADAGLRRLSDLLGEQTDLDEWWDSLL